MALCQNKSKNWLDSFLDGLGLQLKQPPSRKKATVLRLITSWVDQANLIAIGLLMLPLYFSVLKAELYGYWLATGGVLVWISMVDMTSITSQRAAASYGRLEYDRCSAYLWSGLLYNGLLVCPLLLLTYWFSLNAPIWFLIPDQYVDGIRMGIMLAGSAIMVQYFGSIGNSFLNALQRSTWILIIRPIAGITQVLVIYVGIQRGMGVISIPAGLLVRNAIIALGALPCAIVYAYSLSRRVLISRVVFADYLRNGPSVFLSVVSGGISQKIQPTLITLFLGPELAAGYDATVRVSLL